MSPSAAMAASWSHRSRCSRPQSGRHRLLDAQLARGLDRRLGDVGIRMLEQREDRRGRRGVADAGKALEREQQQLGILAAEHADQVRYRVRPLTLERA